MFGNCYKQIHNFHVIPALFVNKKGKMLKKYGEDLPELNYENL